MINKKNLLYLSLFFALILVPMRSMYVYGATSDSSTGTGYSSSGSDKKGKNETLKQSAVNMMEAILRITNSNPNTNGEVNQPSSSPTPPLNTQYPNYTSTPNSSNPYLTTGEYIMYRQGDYSNPLPGGCTIAYAGCGPTSVTNIIANFRNQSINPPQIVQQYYRSSGTTYANCSGSSLAGAKSVLDANGFQTSVITFQRPTNIEQAVTDLIPFLKQGAWIFAGADFKYGGHYFVIIDIINKGDGYEVIGLDSAYGNRSTIPINYKQADISFKIKSALAVYP